MRAGYLYLQTHSDHPEMIRVLTSEHSPHNELGQPPTTIPYIARFNDLDAAKMHFHNELRRKLVNIDANLYRVPLAEAIATIEAEELRHQRVWIDPALSASALNQVETITAQQQKRHRRKNIIWRAVGVIAIFWLLLNAFSGLS